MLFDLSEVPFSRRGSYFAISRLAMPNAGPPALWLRTVHGGVGTRELFELQLVHQEVSVDFEVEATPSQLTLSSPHGTIELCFADADRLVVGGSGHVALRLVAHPVSPYETLLDQGDGRWQVIRSGSDINIVVARREGKVGTRGDWTGSRHTGIAITITPDESGNTAAEISEFRSHRPQERRSYGPDRFADCRNDAQRDFDDWLSSTLPAPQHPETRELAAYVNWSAMVNPDGHLLRPSMYMSKNWMTNVWSWDHCFNAMALHLNPQGAADQFLTMFDQADDWGALPDFVNDRVRDFSFCKPPIHGWALRWLMQRTQLGAETLSLARAGLTAWTRWWLDERPRGVSGTPQYHHGNDSGWDNSTAFADGVPLESPDLVAFLALQTEVLGDLAKNVGEETEAEHWFATSRDLIKLLIERFWVGDRFVARLARSGELVESDSLLMFMPLILGHRLPGPIRTALIDRLISLGFVTDFGLATERPASPSYVADGYWRGPIWAPSTLILIDGLRESGEGELAGDLARRFCSLVAKSGMAENFDAVTGRGLRDRAYTWTASVFLVLSAEYN